MITPNPIDFLTPVPHRSSSDLTSLASDVTRGLYENGRRYHSYGSSQYAFPNDERELDRLDMQHSMMTLLLENKLFWSPLNSPHKVLDLGTGTGGCILMHDVCSGIDGRVQVSGLWISRRCFRPRKSSARTCPPSSRRGGCLLSRVAWLADEEQGPAKLQVRDRRRRGQLDVAARLL